MWKRRISLKDSSNDRPGLGRATGNWRRSRPETRGQYPTPTESVKTRESQRSLESTSNETIQ